jgi:hypothetical protein
VPAEKILFWLSLVSGAGSYGTTIDSGRELLESSPCEDSAVRMSTPAMLPLESNEDLELMMDVPPIIS